MDIPGSEDESGVEFLFEYTTDCIVEGTVHDGDPIVHRVNDAFERVFGYTSSELRGENLNDYITPDGMRSEAEAVDQAWREGDVGPREVVRQTADGPRHFLHRAAGNEEGVSYAIYTDITEQKEREQEIQTQRDNLHLLNKVIRHDLRNDLQLIELYADMLDEELDSEYLDIIRDSVENAIDLTQSARDLSTVMMSEEVHLEQQELAQVIGSQMTEQDDAFPEATFELVNIDRATVAADDMLSAVFRNLLKNAVIHNDKQTPTVELSMQQDEETVRVFVADNGPGVPEDKREDIFGEGEKGLYSDGTGIGLYLVKTLVDRYDGDVWVEDREGQSPSGNRPGADDNDPEGAVFVVELPLAT
jgi:PAS domain S-box-containing protein